MFFAHHGLMHDLQVFHLRLNAFASVGKWWVNSIQFVDHAAGEVALGPSHPCLAFGCQGHVGKEFPDQFPKDTITLVSCELRPFLALYDGLSARIIQFILPETFIQDNLSLFRRQICFICSQRRFQGSFGIESFLEVFIPLI